MCGNEASSESKKSPPFREASVVLFSSQPAHAGLWQTTRARFLSGSPG